MDHKKSYENVWKYRVTSWFSIGLTYSCLWIIIPVALGIRWHDIYFPSCSGPMLFWESQVGVDVVPYACARAWLACVCSVAVGTSGSMQSQVTLKWAGITERSNGQQTESLMWASIQQVILRELLPMAYFASADCCRIPSRTFQLPGMLLF